ncbi:hypothetical protein P4O66_013944 [Electrophorus voltai]|uniref:Uncharacterized protein n=1 Tax=Electrophorus voltai TaxID=2609070 RepID=A0AAD8YR95_9TELE|nr:hypothetical protein P4O66_013944 [Electrophorus voltai]
MPGKKSKRRKRGRVPLEDFRGVPIAVQVQTHTDFRDWYTEVQYLSRTPQGATTPRDLVILASRHTPTTGEEATGRLGGPPPSMVQGQILESHSLQPDYEDQHSEVDSAGSYDLNRDCYKGYVDYGNRGECSDSLRSKLESDYVEDPPMEVEEVLYGDPPTDNDVQSAVSKNDKPPTPKIPPRRYRLGARKSSHGDLVRGGKLPSLGHTAPELLCLYRSLVEARRERDQCQPQR